MGGASLIKVLMFVGLFQGDLLVRTDRHITTLGNCEAAKSYAVEFNSRSSWFWESEIRNRVTVTCLTLPGEREA